MLGPKKIHTRNLITIKIPAARKFPPPPITFLMVRPLKYPFADKMPVFYQQIISAAFPAITKCHGDNYKRFY